MAAFGYKFVSSSDLDKIVNRLTRPTTASKAWNHDYDCEAVNLAHLKKRDPKVHKRSRSVTPKQLEEIAGHLHRPTTASTAKNFDFDQQDANLYYLKSKDSKITLPFRSLTPSTLRAASATVSGSVHGSRITSANTSNNSINMRAKSAKRSRFGSSSSSSDGKAVSELELDNIVDRLVRPTVSSLGGKPLADKKFEYIPTPNKKTLPNIPGLDTKYLCNKKVNNEEFEDIVSRLTKPTKATKSRSAPDPHTRFPTQRRQSAIAAH